MLFNKQGFGLRDMLIYSGVIVVFFFVAIYFIVSMYHEFSVEVTVDNYQKLEKQLEENALIYINDYYEGDLYSDGMIINRSLLRAHDLDVALIDRTNHACSGYVYANKTHGKINTKAYIKCNSYMTDGYEEWKMS